MYIMNSGYEISTLRIRRRRYRLRDLEMAIALTRDCQVASSTRLYRLRDIDRERETIAREGAGMYNIT